MSEILETIQAAIQAASSMQPADLGNSLFEVGGGFFALNHCRVLHEDKGTRGVSLLSSVFFTTWGFWNLYYYTALSQPLSFYGAIFLVAANSLYLGMMLHYRKAGPCHQLQDDEETFLAPESVGYQLGELP